MSYVITSESEYSVNYLLIYGSVNTEEETPVPIPNTAVKLLKVNGTSVERLRESR